MNDPSTGSGHEGTGSGHEGSGNERTDDGSAVLVLNAGSSSLKYQLVVPETAEVRAKGLVERVGEPGSGVADHTAAMGVVTDQLGEAGVDLGRAGLRAVGHRVVHGGPDFSDPVLVDDRVVDDIRRLVPLAPLHNPGAIAGIEAARAAFDVPQVAVFDTAFFTSLPAAASTYALPEEVRTRHQVRRYGFHGTSHRYVSRAVAEHLGRIGRLPVVDALEVGGPPPSVDASSASRVKDLLARTRLRPDVGFDGPVLLVDDTIRSRWTLTVAGALLADAGATQVLPLALHQLP